MSAVDCASKRVNGTSKRASGPVFQSVFLVILDHIAVVFSGAMFSDVVYSVSLKSKQCQAGLFAFATLTSWA